MGDIVLSIIIKLGIGILNIIFALFKLLPVQNKITYISRQMNTTPDDFQRLYDYNQFNHPEIRQVILAKMIPDGKIKKIGYCFHMITQMYHIATSKVIVLDTYCIPVSILHQRKSLVVIQIWHALGAFKKFGYSVLDTKEGRSSKTAKLMHMHENYTYVLTSSEHCLPYFQQAFNVRRDQMKIYPLPRLDLFFDQDYKNKTIQKIYTQYPILKDTNKKIIVYSPTFRRDSDDLLIEGIHQFIDELSDEYMIVLKKHPISKFKINDDRIIEDESFDSMSMYLIADYIVTDYSAGMYEASLINKPIYFYAFDYKDYVVSRDFYEPYEKLVPGTIAYNAKELHKALHSDQDALNRVSEFSKTMIQPFKKSYTEDLGEFIYSQIK